MKKKPKRYGLSDSTLSSLWRKAVEKDYGNCCIICNSSDSVECHHIIHRKIKILRWDRRNGVPVCAPLTGRNCHAFCDTFSGRENIRDIIGMTKYAYIRSMEHVVHKDYLRENNLSETDWRLQVKEQLIKE